MKTNITAIKEIVTTCLSGKDIEKFYFLLEKYPRSTYPTISSVMRQIVRDQYEIVSKK